MSVPHGNPSDSHTHGPPVLPEPKTPMWLPALGVVLFLLVGLIWTLTPDESSDADGASSGSAKSGETTR